MAELIYSAITSLDGYVSDADGRFDWSMPDEAVHAAVNELVRPVGTHLYGRRIYEVMRAWETFGTEGDPAPIRDFGEIWRGADKVVYSRTLTGVASARTRVEPSFDADAVRALKESADRDLAIGGPTLAGLAFQAGLVDQVSLFVSPVVVGGGLRALPDGVRLDLELVDEHRFANGVVHLHHRVQR